jgi:hypothetical protein
VGQALGSVTGGWLYGMLTVSSFLVMAGLMLAGALIGLFGNKSEAR